MKVKDFLTRERWTQEWNARDNQNNPVDIDSPDAVKFCLIGAIVYCYKNNKTKIFNKVLPKVEGFISEWNDDPDRTYEEVHNLCVELDI